MCIMNKDMAYFPSKMIKVTVFKMHLALLVINVIIRKLKALNSVLELYGLTE